jgi:calcineurin-like phosphoesterase family protein
LKTKHFVVSDLHFGHANVILYEQCRAEALAKLTGYTVELVNQLATEKQAMLLQTHNQMLVDAWNSVVGPEDVVFFLGDFCLTKNAELIRGWVSQLNGRKRMIMGNHDVRKPGFYMECGFESVSQYPVLYNRHIFLSHEPLPHEIVPKGYINFFGHVHGNTEFNWERGICVSVEQLPNFAPIPIDRYIGDWSELYPDRHKIAD